jgi:hypothetical protein
MVTDCVSPRVTKFRLAVNAGPLATYLKADAFDPAGQGSGGIAGGLAPGACDRAGGVGLAAAQIEIIAVAGAVDIELKLVLLL